MSSTQMPKSVQEIIRDKLPSTTENTDVLAANFDAPHLNTLITALSGVETPPRVRVLSSDSALKDLRRSYSAASRGAELVEKDALELRLAENDNTLPPDSNLLFIDERVHVLITTSESVGTLSSDSGDERFVESLYNDYEHAFKDSEEFNLRTPSRTRVSETLTEEFDANVEETFSQLVQEGNLEGLTDTEQRSLKPAYAAVLAAAIHEELLYDISTWSEDVGLASRATISRSKNHLENKDLIDTEKVPIDIGRPRQRLLRTTRSLPS